MCPCVPGCHLLHLAGFPQTVWKICRAPFAARLLWANMESSPSGLGGLRAGEQRRNPPREAMERTGEEGKPHRSRGNPRGQVGADGEGNLKGEEGPQRGEREPNTADHKEPLPQEGPKARVGFVVWKVSSNGKDNFIGMFPGIHFHQLSL